MTLPQFDGIRVDRRHGFAKHFELGFHACQVRAATSPAGGPGDRPKVRTDRLAPDTLVADMVGPFLVSQWEALEHGDKVKCRFIVVPRTETVGFTFLKDSVSSWQGHQVLVVRMEPTSKFVSLLVDPLFFTIEKNPPHRVLRYLGCTTPKIQVHGKWKDLDAETIFDLNSAR